jgi:hypothetical protein
VGVGERIEALKKTHSERWGGLGGGTESSLAMTRELSEENFEDLWPFEWSGFRKAIEKYGLRG